MDVSRDEGIEEPEWRPPPADGCARPAAQMGARPSGAPRASLLSESGPLARNADWDSCGWPCESGEAPSLKLPDCDVSTRGAGSELEAADGNSRTATDKVTTMASYLCAHWRCVSISRSLLSRFVFLLLFFLLPYASVSEGAHARTPSHRAHTRATLAHARKHPPTHHPCTQP